MNANKILLLTIATSLALPQMVFAQCNLVGAPSGTLRSPLVSGSSSAPPFIEAPEGQSPACGDGMTPVPVLPGHGGPPTLLPWVPAIPSNQIDQTTSGIPLPITPAIEMPPGVLGPALTGVVPAPPSTPGMDPGSLTAPMGSFNPSQELNINPTGGIPGTGGYCTTIPNVRRGGQQTHQWELRGRNSSLGNLFPGDGSQDQVELLGPVAGWGVPFGVATGTRNLLRNNSIDLGGGQRFSAGGNRISTGSTVQDYGLSSMRNNPIPALRGNQAYEYGQGRRRMPRYSNKTSDFGFPYAQFAPCNTNPQKTDQLLLPTAVITNF